MNEQEFDRSLSDFLEDDRCDELYEAINTLIQGCFIAGWKAALESDFAKMTDIMENRYASHEALSDFVNDENSEEINNFLFALVRMSFTAGWKKALGEDVEKMMDIEEDEDETG